MLTAYGFYLSFFESFSFIFITLFSANFFRKKKVNFYQFVEERLEKYFRFLLYLTSENKLSESKLIFSIILLLRVLRRNHEIFRSGNKQYLFFIKHVFMRSAPDYFLKPLSNQYLFYPILIYFYAYL
jgi:hypothetical protein